MNSLLTEPQDLFAQWLWAMVYEFLKVCHLPESAAAQSVVYVVFVIIVALIIGVGLRRVAIVFLRNLKIFNRTRLGSRLVRLKTIDDCTLFIAPSVFLGLGSYAFSTGGPILVGIQKCVVIYLFATLAIGACALLKLEWSIFNEKYNTKNHPLDGVYNMCCGIIWIIAVILSASVIINRSPLSLLAGLGAVSAALLLVFRDSILGLVATLQLSSNDMVRKGDWIIVDGTNINGTVMAVTLTSVKVQNWDNTTSMISPYKLVSGCFQNYRSMYEVGARRIKSSIYVDPCSVTATTKELFASIAEKYPEMRPQIEKARAPGGMALTQDPLQSGMKTNLGLFRAYLFTYLEAHPQLAKDQTILVNLRDEEEFGIPIQIYCFSKTTSWVPYEKIHDEVIEHAFVSASDFGLSLCNYSNYNNQISFAADADKTAASDLTQTSLG